MTESISPETRNRIETLLRDIAAGQHLDADTIEELRAHMEEKFIAYINGAETITEEDAMLLVREHFGKLEVVRAGFQETMEKFSLPLFMRWFGAAITVLIGVSATNQFFYEVQERLFIASSSLFGQSSPLSHNAINFLMMAPSVFFEIVGVLFMYWIFRRWLNGEKQGRLWWYNRFSILQIFMIAIVVFSMGVFFETIFSVRRFQLENYFITSESTYVPSLEHIEFLVYLLRSSMYIGQFVLILWWLGRKPRHLNITAGFIFLYLYSIIHYPLRNLVFVMFGESSMPLGIGILIPNSFILKALFVYLIIHGYVILRGRLISTFKPARAFHD